MSLPIAPSLDFTEIPVIDLHSLIAKKDVNDTISQLIDACERVGFFYIENHGVDTATIENLVVQAKQYFALPMAEKERLLVDHTMRGYLPLYYKSYQGQDREGMSHQEGFWIGHERGLSSARPLDAINRWPLAMPEFRVAMETYFFEVEKLSVVLQQGFEYALNLPEGSLQTLFVEPTSRLKLNHYPPQNNPDDEHNIGVIPHTDSGAFTILWQDHHGGLEVKNKKGEWVGAPPKEDTFVVNLGNLMQTWSNNRFSSTQHRVINRGNNDRYSIPLFVNPGYDVVIEPLLDQTDNDSERFTYGAYQADFWRQAFPVANISKND